MIDLCMKNAMYIKKIHVYLFNVKEILRIKGDGCGWYWNILIQRATVADISPYSKGHRLRLECGNIFTVRIHKYFVSTRSLTQAF